MELKDNPLLQQEDYAAGYKDSIQKLKNNPHIVAFDKLCYETFKMNAMGIKFMEYVEEHFLISGLVARTDPKYETLVIWADGFKDAFRTIRNSIKSHEQRIKAEVNK
jgi:hypothetical protein